MRQIEKPELISTILDKRKVWLNIRESRLMYMFHRKLISIEEYEENYEFLSNTIMALKYMVNKFEEYATTV